MTSVERSVKRMGASTIAAVLVLCLLVLWSDYEGRQAVVKTSRSTCLTSSYSKLYTLDRDFAIFTADADDPSPMRHREAVEIRLFDLPQTSSVDHRVLAVHGTYALRWPVMRSAITRTSFSCARAHPGAPPISL